MRTTGAKRSAAYHACVRLMRELADLEAKGMSETAQDELVRHSLEETWFQMSNSEQGIVDALSADLRFLEDPKPLGPTPGPAEQTAFSVAERSESWDDVAALLRDYPTLAGGPVGAAVRARCWMALGEVDIALEFSLQSRRLERAQGSPGGISLLARRRELHQQSGARRFVGRPTLFEIAL